MKGEEGISEKSLVLGFISSNSLPATELKIFLIVCYFGLSFWFFSALKNPHSPTYQENVGSLSHCWLCFYLWLHLFLIPSLIHTSSNCLIFETFLLTWAHFQCQHPAWSLKAGLNLFSSSRSLLFALICFRVTEWPKQSFIGFDIADWILEPLSRGSWWKQFRKK